MGSLELVHRSTTLAKTTMSCDIAVQYKASPTEKGYRYPFAAFVTEANR
jgi:hypothetical protein